MDKHEWLALALVFLQCVGCGGTEPQRSALASDGGLKGAQTSDVGRMPPRTDGRAAARRLIEAAIKEVPYILTARDRAKAYGQILRAHLKAADIAAAKATLRQVTTEEERAAACCEIALAHAKRGEVADAELMVQQVGDAPMKWSIYHQIALAQLTAGDKHAARRSLALAQVAAARTGKSQEKVTAYCETAAAQAKAGATGEAIRAVEAADALVADMSALNEARVINYQSPERLPYSELLAARTRAGDLAGARAAAEQLSSEWDRNWSYYLIAVAQADAGDINGAAETASRASSPESTCRELVKNRTEAADFDGARTIADRLSVGVSRVEAYAEVAAAQSRRGDLRSTRSLAAAKATAAEIKDDYSKALAYHALATGQMNVGHVSEAQASLKIAKTAAATIAGDCCYAKARLLAKIAETELLIGDTAAARQTLDAAKAVSKQIAEKDRRAEVACAIAVVQAKGGDLPGAKAAVEQIDSDFFKMSAYAGLVSTQISAGAFDDAKVLAEKISERAERVQACCKIARAESQCGDVAGAIAYITSLTDDPRERCEWLAGGEVKGSAAFKA